MSLKDFIVFLYSDAGRTAYGLAAWGAVGWCIRYVEDARHGGDMSNDTKRLITLAGVALFTVLVQLLGIAAGYVDGSIEGWWRVFAEIAAVGMIVFTFTKAAGGSTDPVAKDNAVLDAVAGPDPLVASKAAAIVVPLDDSGQPKP